MTRVVNWDGTDDTELRLSSFADTGDVTWAETRRNLFVPTQIKQLFAVASPQTFGETAGYRSFHLPVVPGRAYSLRRLAPFTDRFQVVFSVNEPAQGVAWSGAKITNNSAEALNGIIAPSGMGWMHIYLSSSSQDIPGLLVEETSLAGPYFDGDTNPSGTTTRTSWVGVPGESESVVEDALTGTTVTVQRTPTPAIFAPTGYHLREDGVSLFGKGEDGITLPASTIKMLTMYIARLYVTDAMLSDAVVLDAGDLSTGSTANLEAGDIVSWDTLFHATLMVSDNGAAHSVARHTGTLIKAAEGGTETSHTTFRNKANALMAEWGWRGAVFQSASGLDVVGRISSRQLCELMFKLDAYTLDTSMVLTYEASAAGPNARNWTINHGLAARFPDFPDLIGVKTGGFPSQESAGVVMLSEISGVRHATAVIGEWPSDDRWTDSRTILDHIESLS